MKPIQINTIRLNSSLLKHEFNLPEFYHLNDLKKIISHCYKNIFFKKKIQIQSNNLNNAHKKAGCKYNRPKQLLNENLVYQFYQWIGTIIVIICQIKISFPNRIKIAVMSNKLLCVIVEKIFPKSF